MGLFDFVKKVVNDVKNTAKEVTDKVTDTVKYVANKAKDIATDIFGKKEEQKVIVKETESIVKRDDERKAALEAEKAKYKADLEKARLDHETEKSRLENERLAKQDELDHQKRLAEIEKEKLTSILAAGTATQQQITKQKELARAAEENARSEAERINKEHLREMKAIDDKLAQEHKESQQRLETRLQEMRAEAAKDRELMEKNRQEQIRLHREIEEQMRERHESEMGLLNELMNNKQIKREEMSVELKEEIAKEKINIEKRYKEELNALEAQKQKEAAWYNGVMQQLNTESEQLEANHRGKMKELKDDLEKAIQESDRLFDVHWKMILYQTETIAELSAIADQCGKNTDFNNIIKRNSEMLITILKLSRGFRDKINLAIPSGNSAPDRTKIQDAEFAKEELKNHLAVAANEANENPLQIRNIKIKETNQEYKAIGWLGEMSNIYDDFSSEVNDFEKNGPRESQIDTLKKLEKEVRALQLNMPTAENMYNEFSKLALQRAQTSLAGLPENPNLPIDSANSTKSNLPIKND